MNIVQNLQSGSGPSDANWMFYQLPAAIAGLATDEFYVEFVPVGGTHYVRGMSFADNIKDHPIAAAPSYGAVVDYSSNPGVPAPSLPKATSSPTVPWVEFAASLVPMNDYHEPQVVTFVADGESIPIPNWCNRVDLIALGEGGDGHDGLTLNVAGEPGQPGKFGSTTLVRGVDFPQTGATFIVFNVLADGTARLSITGREVLGKPGENGAGTKFGLTPVGAGPGPYSYNGQNYIGGLDQKVTGAPGTSPGGAGNGGNGLFFQQGGKGGKPAGWACFRQVESSGDVSVPDTTPPTAPTTLTLQSSTPSSLTIDWSGATD